MVKEKPKIILRELENMVVSIPTQEESKTLMQVYECGGWNWSSGQLPLGVDHWSEYKRKTCIEAGDKFGFGALNVCFEKKVVISPSTFYDVQGITPEKLEEINQWFEE